MMSIFRLTGILPAIFFLVVVTAGCDRDTPKDLIEEDKYIDVLVEMHLLAAAKEIDDDEKRFQADQKAILTYYGISLEQFQRSHTYYHRDMSRQMHRFGEVRSRLEDLGSELTDHYHQQRDTIPASIDP